MSLTKREAAIIAAYTGYLIGEFHEMHVYIEELVGHPVFTHELASPAVREQIKQLAKKDFIALSPKG